MTILDVLITSTTAMRTNLLRTFLSMLGIIIAIGAVIGLTAATEGKKEGISERIRGLGSDLLVVRPGATQQGGVASLPGLGASLYYEDAVAIGDADFDYVDGMASLTGSGGGSGTGTGTGSGSGTGSGLGPGFGGGMGGGAYQPGAGITLPRVLREVKPQYTADAMRAKIQGSVWLQCIVMPDGSVGEVKVTKSLDPIFGLDQEAIKAARGCRFSPVMKHNEPVPVIITIELTFTLR